MFLLVGAVAFRPSMQAQNAQGEKATRGTANETKQEERKSAVDLIREDQLLGLPLNGRSYSSLATLQTGVSDSGAASASRGVGGGNLSVAGGRNTSNNYLNDGTNIQNAAPRACSSARTRCFRCRYMEPRTVPNTAAAQAAS
jgi:hypothetical protein